MSEVSHAKELREGAQGHKAAEGKQADVLEALRKEYEDYRATPLEQIHCIVDPYPEDRDHESDEGLPYDLPPKEEILGALKGVVEDWDYKKMEQDYEKLDRVKYTAHDVIEPYTKQQGLWQPPFDDIGLTYTEHEFELERLVDARLICYGLPDPASISNYNATYPKKNRLSFWESIRVGLVQKRLHTGARIPPNLALPRRKEVYQYAKQWRIKRNPVAYFNRMLVWSTVWGVVGAFWYYFTYERPDRKAFDAYYKRIYNK